MGSVQRPWALLNALNLLDAGLTLVAVHLGATEANPVMALLVNLATVFIIAKVGVVWLGSTVLGILEMRRVLWAGVLLYGAVVVWQVANLLTAALH